MQFERRKGWHRKPFTYPAFLDCEDGRDLIPCTFSDISATGARISLQEALDIIPEEVTLVLSRRGGVRRHCAVVWSREAEIGLKFHTAERSNGRLARLAGGFQPIDRPRVEVFTYAP